MGATAFTGLGRLTREGMRAAACAIDVPFPLFRWTRLCITGPPGPRRAATARRPLQCSIRQPGTPGHGSTRMGTCSGHEDAASDATPSWTSLKAPCTQSVGHPLIAG
jgi:hypothetical protein